MDYQRMMMETPEETMRRFERKRKLKEVLCRFGLIAHKIRLGDTTHFAFALATPGGTPIARPCSSEDLAQCSQWLASKYPTHFFFQGVERPSVYEFQGREGSSDARYEIAAPSDSNDLLKNVMGQLATSNNNTDLFPATDLRSNYRMCGTIRDERAGLAVEQRFRDVQPSELLGIVDQPEDFKHCERSTPPEVSLSPWGNLMSTDSPHVVKRSTCRSRNWNEVERAREGTDRKAENRSGAHGHEQLKQSREDGYHKERGSAHGEHRERGSSYVDHRHRTDRKDRSIIECHHQSRDGLRVRRKTRRVGSRTTQNQPLNSDEGSWICGQELPASTNGLTRDKLDLTSRMVVRMLNVEKWDCSKQGGPPEAGLGLRGDKIMLESDAESRPQELSTPPRTVSGRQKRIDSSDVSLSPEPYGLEGFAPSHSHTNGSRRHSGKDVSIDSRHAHHEIQRTGFRERTRSYPLDHIGKGGNPELGEDRGAIPDYNIIVANEDLVHPNDKSWKEGFESGAWLACDVCNLGGKTKHVPDVKALVSHAKTTKRIKMGEYRGYARAICELMNFDAAALDHDDKGPDKAIKKPAEDAIVWPPVLVLENSRTEKGLNGLWKGVDATELTEVLEGTYPTGVS